MLSTNDVLNRHLGSFAERDVDGVLADYASDAVLFAPGGPLKGPEAIRPLFQNLVAEFAKPGSSFHLLLRSIDGDHAYIVWSAETADNCYEFATDTFVVRNGKIVAQSFAARIKPKLETTGTADIPMLPLLPLNGRAKRKSFDRQPTSTLLPEGNAHPPDGDRSAVR